MAVTLCFDFGNTRKKVAVFEGDQKKQVLSLQDDTDETIRILLDEFQPQKTILSSVINHNPNIETILAQRTKFHLLNHTTQLTFTTPVGKPQSIGTDRLALISAAVNLYPGQHVLVIALGTCVTYNFVNKYSEFIGGAISPGLEMRLKSLQYYTAKLPLVKAYSDAPVLGYDTETNILSGVLIGMSHEIEGFIADYKQKFKKFNVVLTGGDIQHLALHLKSKIFADPDLLFKGLYAISEKNNV
ncbi:MAG: type III pantothenate kinase [Chitinophagaceae bacterium]|nr:MAG: type III pantothenate kinase [Chitinophagaceae bacterium]